jgi:hypothetical protein
MNNPPNATDALMLRIDEATKRITSGMAPMRIPADLNDADIVLSDCETVIRELTTALTDSRRQTEEARKERDDAVQYRTGHLPSCHGMDEAAGRCACGYLQGDAYRDLIDRLDEMESERDTATAALSQARGEWVACATKMPEETTLVLVCVAGSPHVYIADHYEGCWYGQDENTLEYDITHWRHLPHPPETSTASGA